MMSLEVSVPNLTVRNIPQKDYASLRKEAERSGRSLNSEILAMIHERSEARRQRRAAMRQIDKLREEIARRFPNQPDSAGLIREDRESH
jgi:hypothetical protein